ncbi:zinc finger protein 708 [Austrofundulus limnaeus]|uniref:Zinc finger protein 708 n=1 Tax=Austrofundulus limnaeus TaxID=52670 RepID=A0A2I4DCT0_AUSLI|nr:PREDICTED: zinc finger protein 708-like [Austrofundulus limnaeus]
MSGSSVFCSEIKSVLKTLVEAAVDVTGGSDEEKKLTLDRRPDFDSVVGLLAREATRTIGGVFSQLIAENAALKTRVGRLESELKTATESLQRSNLWRENVLSGCPVLFQDSGLVFTLKPLGKLTINSNRASEGDHQTSPAAGQGPDGGETLDEEILSPANEQDSAQDFAVTNAPELQNPPESVVRTAGKVFVCEVCEKTFTRQFHLMKHMNVHRDRRPFACDQCPRRFTNAQTFELHLLRHEEKKQAAFPCRLCEKTFRTKACLKTHQLVHSDTRPFGCSACGKAFKTKHNLQAHRAVHLVEKPHKCSECGESFRNTISLQCHRSVHTGENPYRCPVCGKTFTGRRSLRTHQAVHRGKLFTCETCGAGFTLRQNLRRHIRIHTGEKPLACKVCGKRFMQDNKLKAHMLLHGATKAFMCDLCGKTFLYNCQLQKHQRVAHDEKRGFRKRPRERADRRVIYRRDKTIVNVTPFSCGSCHKSFDSAASLKKHELIHTGDRKHTCSQCGRSFFYKATYQYHLRIHSGERPFACDVCGERFIIRQALVSHSLQHSGEKPHKCEQCGKTFRIYTNYLRHLRIHTGEKPYECEVCGVRFRQLGHVKFHMQVHTGERPLSCSSCGLGFSDSRLLKKHKCNE